MHQQAKSNNVVGLALVLVTLCLVLAWLSLMPMVKSSRQRARDSQATVKQAQDKLASFDTVNGKISEIKDIIDRVAIAVPEDSNYQSILVSLEAIGSKESLPIYSFQPSQKTTSSSGSAFPRLSFSFSSAGDYAHLTALVKDLETNLRIFSIDSMSLSQVDASQAQLSVTVSTYYRSSQSGGQ